MVIEEDFLPQNEPSKGDTKPLNAAERMLLILPANDPFACFYQT
jgi:hypothetical protein